MGTKAGDGGGVRVELGDDAPPAVVLDAQATRGSPPGGATGYDAGNKVKGCKRHLFVDTLGLLRALSVTAANVQNRAAAYPGVEEAITIYTTVETLFVDAGYADAVPKRSRWLATSTYKWCDIQPTSKQDGA